MKNRYQEVFQEQKYFKSLKSLEEKKKSRLFLSDQINENTHATHTHAHVPHTNKASSFKNTL